MDRYLYIVHHKGLSYLPDCPSLPSSVKVLSLTSLVKFDAIFYLGERVELAQASRSVEQQKGKAVSAFTPLNSQKVGNSEKLRN